jgi:hypothetical protein
MSEKRCPAHPELDTMVVCLECGREYCRVCFPIRGAGQCCPQCHKKNIERLASERGAEKEPKRAWSERLKARLPTASSAKDKARGLGEALGARVPFELSTTGAEELPPVSRAISRLAAVTFSGLVLWFAMVLLAHRRLMVFSIVAAAVIATGVVLSLGVMHDLGVAVLAAAMAVLALVVGELLIQLLYRAGIVTRLDVFRMSPYIETPAGVFYKGFFYDLLVRRLLPAAAVAFIVGIWPLPKIPVWRGFRSKSGSPDRQVS